MYTKSTNKREKIAIILSQRMYAQNTILLKR